MTRPKLTSPYCKCMNIPGRSLAMGGDPTCRECKGEGFIADLEPFDEARKNYSKTALIEMIERGDFDDDGG